MIIDQILNNNCALCMDDDNSEVVITGTGVAFGKRIGDKIDTSIANIKVYKLESENDNFDAFRKIPSEFYVIAEEMLDKASDITKANLTGTKLLLFVDHIYVATERIKHGKHLKNNLLNEIMMFYPDEYKLGIETCSLLNKNFGINADEHEAAFIAMHFVNLQMRNMEVSNQIPNIINDVASILKDRMNIDIKTDSYLNYRFITHLKYLIFRMLNDEISTAGFEDEFAQLVRSIDSDTLSASYLIKDCLDEQFDLSLNKNEMVYLMIHIENLRKNKK